MQMELRVTIAQSAIQQRRIELHRLAGILASQASRQGRISRTLKVVIIFLGAFVATGGVANIIFGPGNIGVLVTYSAVGLTIATIAGLTMGFRFDERFTEINRLAADTQTALWSIDSQWQKTVGGLSGQERLDAAHAVIDEQDSHLRAAQARAVEQGVNVTAQLRELDEQGEQAPV